MTSAILIENIKLGGDYTQTDARNAVNTKFPPTNQPNTLNIIPIPFIFHNVVTTKLS
mgnify:CR=1 FL=1